MSSTMEERTARLEGINEQIRDRLNSLDLRLDSLERTLEVRFDRIEGRFGQIDGRFAQIEGRFTQIDQRFMWLTGLVLGTWITTILTILFHH
ncbi:MAG: hypothetical protein JO350_09470 [Candidatus Eremiobacteraeota bacterium]|nr:hypothetical protein [Candidatus Eremiobacteraeota bacterium]